MALSNHFSFLSFWRRALWSFFFIRLLAFRLSADVPFCSVCIGLVDLAGSAVSCISAVAPVSSVCVPSIGLVDLTDSAFCVAFGLVPSQQVPMNCFDHRPSSPSEVQSQCIHFLQWLHFTDHSFFSLILIPHNVHSYPFFRPGLTSMSWCNFIRIHSDLCLGLGLVTNACNFPHQSAIQLGLKVEVCLTMLLTLKTPLGPSPPPDRTVLCSCPEALRAFPQLASPQPNTSQVSSTSSSPWSKPEPSVFEKWPWRCTSQRASSSVGTTPIHMRIRFVFCPSFTEGPALRQKPSPVW